VVGREPLQPERPDPRRQPALDQVLEVVAEVEPGVAVDQVMRRLSNAMGTPPAS
jgi:hypothetical protein